MEVKLVDYSKNGQETIAAGASVCYQSNPKDLGRIKRLKNVGHLATLRFAFAVVSVKGISVACQNQIVRSKFLDYLVKSLRYTTPGNFIVPKAVDEDTQQYMQEISQGLFQAYETLLEKGVKKEDARAILPLNTETEIYIAGNLQAWVDFLHLRVNSHAQAEIREVAVRIWRELTKQFPLVFDDLLMEDKTLDYWETKFGI